MIDPKLLEILACPACDERPPLRLDGEFLICDLCGRGYPINDDIPEVLVDSALSPEQRKSGISLKETP